MFHPNEYIKAALTTTHKTSKFALNQHRHSGFARNVLTVKAISVWLHWHMNNIVTLALCWMSKFEHNSKMNFFFFFRFVIKVMHIQVPLLLVVLVMKRISKLVFGNVALKDSDECYSAGINHVRRTHPIVPPLMLRR